MPRYALAGILTVALAGSAAVPAQPRFTPARYVSGDLPAIPVLAVSGGEVFLEVRVAGDGHVDAIRTLRTTPPFTDAVIQAVRGWRFKPAAEIVTPPSGQPEAPPQPVAGSVFVAAIFAPPVLNGPTLGQPPQDLASASPEAPMPMTATPAPYPPRAMGNGTVLVEVTIDSAAALTDARVVVSSPAFDAAAKAAAKSWSFLVARRKGDAVKAHAYLVFGFQQPVTGR
jgi:TonB family protein